MMTPPSSPPSSIHNKALPVRFLGILKQPDSDPYLLELHECDVVWPSSADFSTDDAVAELGSSEDRKSGSVRVFHRSAPVNVPCSWGRNGHGRGFMMDDVESGEEEGEEEDEEEEEMLPPHVIVAAKSHVTSFSVFEGMGRTLKGRDLRRVRNAVFQKTGFLD